MTIDFTKKKPKTISSVLHLKLFLSLFFTILYSLYENYQKPIGLGLSFSFSQNWIELSIEYSIYTTQPRVQLNSKRADIGAPSIHPFHLHFPFQRNRVALKFFGLLGNEASLVAFWLKPGIVFRFVGTPSACTLRSYSTIYSLKSTGLKKNVVALILASCNNNSNNVRQQWGVKGFDKNCSNEIFSWKY